ncbi:PLD nuclease N-terminal domain-containing protein [Aestuariibius sp. 2305UL40-4]|uniref:PLD nuclease N-terminal domain-containing protein n=1 Tax=Aestuariibius violaceus TaxID=3234132 RepID=UPI00345E52FB
MEYGILGLIHLALIIYALYNILTSGASMGGKVLWSLGVIFFPIVGFIVWLIAGPRGSSATV